MHVYKQRQLAHPSVNCVFDYVASSGVCAICPMSVLCVFAVSGGWHSKAWFSLFGLFYQRVEELKWFCIVTEDVFKDSGLSAGWTT